MFLSHEDVLWSKQWDLEETAWRLAVAGRFMPDATEGGNPAKDLLCLHPCSMLIAYLKQLPPYAKLRKISDKLNVIAKNHGAEIFRLRWWDMTQSKRILAATVRRPDGREVPTLLMWKKSETSADKARLTTFHTTDSLSWAFDREAPDGWRFEIECEVFKHIKEAFARWLAAELPPYPYIVKRPETT